ncbi:Nucleotide exchange factor SIL1 [Chionoecetes opilio]|uniref:Nucleotide exchange factor SIL1 n=1 Tax=Chionoecetes opilio TaxID=41210 RepID=A0A8J4YFT4_CHIOP|nr:Nucleotide exchange factor SIL1 [Chionoecetes opilio]
MDGQMARWAEYFGQLFTVDPPTEQLHTTGLQAVDADPPIDETAPSLDEVREAVAKLKGGKAAGVCNISAELLKAGSEAMFHGLHAVLTAMWQSGTIPPDWKRGLVVPIWKGKGDRQDCNNYRSITLLSVPGKVLAHLLLTRIRSHLVKHQRPQQSGFTPGKSTMDRILALRVLVERRREFRQGMLAAYVDLKKAFDSVHLIFAESLEVLVMALEALHEEAKPLGFEVSWLKTKVQVEVARKAVFALSCLVRGFPYGQKVLVQNGGLEVLRKVFDRDDFQSMPLQIKVVALLHDLLMEREEAEGERLQQLQLFKLDEQLAIGGWCPVVSSLLTVASFDRRDRRYDMGAALRNKMPLRPDHDTVDKVVSAMSSMVGVCRYQFINTLPILRHLARTYDDLAYKERFQDDDGGHALFKGLSDTIQRLVRDIGLKNEL